MCKYGDVRSRLTSRTPHASFALVATATVAALVLSACSSSSDSANVTSTNDNVQYNECTAEVCDTTVNGFPVKIKLPTIWNGTLMVFSHGYRGEEPIPPAKSVPEAAAQLAPSGSQDGIIADAMVQAGYAVAGAAVPATGWQVDEQLKAAEAVKQQFADHIAIPDRVYAWGESTGALASVQLAQTADWVNGAVGYCGLMAGFNKNYDLALDAAASVKALLYPEMKLTGYKNLAEAQKNFDGAMKAVKKAAAEPYGGTGAMKLFAVAAAAVVPTTTTKQSSTGARGSSKGITANLRTVLARSTLDRFTLERQFGGNPSSNVGTNYFARPTSKQVEEGERVDKGALEKYLRKIQNSKRVSPNAEARTKAGANGKLTGEMKVPTVTLHTQYDPLAIVQNEGDLVGKAVEVGNDSRKLLSANVTSPPMFYDEKEPAKYGVGHCNFTDESVVGAVRVLNEWVRDSKFPTKMSIQEALGADSGFDPDFPLFIWPGGAKP